jgi:acetoin utilization protein AcuB
MVVSQHMSVPPITIRADADYQSVLALMQEHAVHHVPVLDPDGALVGIVTERDLLLAASRYLQAHVDVGDIMHRDVVTVAPDTPLQQAAALLARHKIGGLPVVAADGRVVGVITETDLLVALVDALETHTVALRPPAKRGLRARPAVSKVTFKPLRRPR